MEPRSLADRTRAWLRQSATLKLAVMGVLVLLLLIPASMIESLIRERALTQQQAVEEVSGLWSAAQTLAGPVLVIPYTVLQRTSGGDVVETVEHAYFLPDVLEVESTLEPEVRHRGLFDVTVYRAVLAVRGTFPAPDFAIWNVDPARVRWREAAVAVGLTDLRGINAPVQLQWGAEAVPFDPGVEPGEVLRTGVQARVPLASGGSPSAFAFDFDLNGSAALYLVPVGKTTRVAMAADWPHPSFGGAFLPDARTVTEAGFQARWEVLHLNRSFPQQWRGALAGGPPPRRMVPEPMAALAEPAFEGSPLYGAAFGVRLLQPVDHYRKATRAAKYAVLVIALTFLAFFFAEAGRRGRVHPFQYVLVGLALCLFYALLLALSEHVGFDAAYGLAAAATISLVALYARSIIRQGRFGAGFGALVGGILIILYGFVFVLLQLEDYALLVGAVGLFLALALTMYLSRRIDWYGDG